MYKKKKQQLQIITCKFLDFLFYNRVSSEFGRVLGRNRSLDIKRLSI